MGLGYPHKPRYESANSLALNLVYEFDWWGTYRNQVNAAYTEQEHTALTLNSLVASDYYQWQSSLALEKLMQQDVDNNARLAALRQQRYQAGITGVDVPQQTQAPSDIAKQQILQLKKLIEVLRRQFAALAGQERGTGDFAADLPRQCAAQQAG